MIRRWIKAGRRQVGGKAKEGRRKVGEISLKWVLERNEKF
jgi:hypothetical protein